MIAAFGVVACTASTTTSAITSAPPASRTAGPADPEPVTTAAVSERVAARCPYLSRDEASSDAGYRLDRLTVLVQDGATVGCRFYPLQHPTAECDQTCLSNENLPPGDVPGVEIRLYRYRTEVDAHSAFVRIAAAGTTLQQFQISPGNVGLCYRTTVWTRDRGRDWACAFSTASTAVVIRTVVTAPALDVAEIAGVVATRI